MSRWAPEKCSHGAMGLAGGCEHCFEAQVTLSCKATERVLLEGVGNDIGARAAKAYLSGNDDEARLLRNIAREYLKKAEQSSRDQDALLRLEGKK